MITKEQFYKSKAWTNFRKVIINERSDAEGYVHCNRCHKTIVNKYDLILHHKIELDDINCNDAMIALNPDNIECICFRCHNQVHDRFVAGKATYKPIQKKVYVVYGSPAAGKSSWVNSIACPDDLIVDLDNIFEMISINPRYEKPDELKSVVFDIRDKLYDIIKYRSGKWHNAFVITGGALKGDRDRLQQRLSADEMILIDTSYDECMNRVKEKNLTDEQKHMWIKFIKNWFDTFQLD